MPVLEKAHVKAALKDTARPESVIRRAKEARENGGKRRTSEAPRSSLITGHRYDRSEVERRNSW